MDPHQPAKKKAKKVKKVKNLVAFSLHFLHNAYCTAHCSGRNYWKNCNWKCYRWYSFLPSYLLQLTSTALCIKSNHIDSLLWLTLQSVGFNRMRTYTNKIYFAVSFNRLSCQFAEKWATQFWAFFPILRNIIFFSNKSLEYESVCFINGFKMIWWQK